MTPSERERRIEAAVRSWIAGTKAGDPIYSQMRAALDAADEAVPVVPATWDGLLEHLDAMYPADVFSGESGDVGARLVVLARRLAEIESKLAEVETAARAVLPLLGMGPAQEFSAEPYRAKARLALVLDESDSP